MKREGQGKDERKCVPVGGVHKEKFNLKFSPDFKKGGGGVVVSSEFSVKLKSPHTKVAIVGSAEDIASTNSTRKGNLPFDVLK